MIWQSRLKRGDYRGAEEQSGLQIEGRFLLELVLYHAVCRLSAGITIKNLFQFQFIGLT
ncbi:hypothetical protein [Pseudoalteromonas viridis]|uniref:Uncharacterized protein n=1 Tax=Pseudoalteromonas viridis TaxID=339617 RepID=A0ABX7VCQ1_9GAMM|nr:hypothetical protein [Pseudoalteromonas viridis]QTL36453.1 hypothetical protein J5X90_05240 [Pseudoalteromonas viridis]